MKSKQEAIEKAWGRYWDEVKHNVNGIGSHGGWADNDVIHYNEDLGCDSKYFEFSGTLYRPKSLAGIETNNGWIRIESEDDLLNIKEKYDHVFLMGIGGGIDIGNTTVLNEKSAIKYWLEYATHYQPIIKPEAPIY